MGEPTQTLHYYVPLNAYFQKVHRECVQGMLKLNTLLVAPSPFFRATVASALAFNFYKLFPDCSIFVLNSELNLPMQLASFFDVGFPKHTVKHIMEKRKTGGMNPPGVFFMQAKNFFASFQAGAMSEHNIKLIIMNEANKALGANVLTRIARMVLDQQTDVRILGLAQTLPVKKLAQIQSIISNLCIADILLKNYSITSDIANALYPNDIKQNRIKFEGMDGLFMDHVKSWKEATQEITDDLISAGLFDESDPDGLIFSENWEAFSGSLPYDLEQKFEIANALIGAYKMLVLYGWRAMYLYIQSKIPKIRRLELAINDSPALSEVLTHATKYYSFPAFPVPTAALFEKMKLSHPKMPQLVNLIAQLGLNNSDGYKVAIFCDSCFGARAVAELLNSSNLVNVMENWTELNTLIRDSRFHGTRINDKDWIMKKFRETDANVLVSSSFIDNFTNRDQFDCVISMDHSTCSLRYMRFGSERHCFLAEPLEEIPSDAFCCDWLSNTQLSYNESLVRFERPNNIFANMGKFSTIASEYYPPSLSTSEESTNRRKSNRGSKTGEKKRRITKEAHDEEIEFRLTEKEEKELDEFGISMDWNWDDADLRDMLNYDATTMLAASRRNSLISFNQFYKRLPPLPTSSLENRDFFDVLMSRFKDKNLAAELKANPNGLVFDLEQGIQLGVVSKAQARKRKTVKRSKKMEVDEGNTNSKQVIICHVQPIWPV
ncbi:fanconi anemia group M protein like protein [Ditylenchus destructor]|uniref:Fanconi anemia group M protein like protein n=1 Tax=Ditylenchus destructor TaxID=166010 RepID=A0AAD4N4F3_9BILA|nr:fanconi anemia group M protein like protein [Ditylenchus destructor]